MDCTEAQLRFGSSFSSMQQYGPNEFTASQYIRHLEERALVANYLNTSATGSTFVGGSGGGVGTTISSRFGSGIDARRKLHIMQLQHEHMRSALVESASSHVVLATPLQPSRDQQHALASRRELAAYALALMRAQSNEHRDLAPLHVDLASLKHAAYVFDALIFYLRASTTNRVSSAASTSSKKPSFVVGLGTFLFI